MIRVVFFTFLAVGNASASVSRAGVDVAPAPREIRPDGTRDPAPQAVEAKRENPLEVVDRIIKNSKAVGDKLENKDTGSETLGRQDKILKDIQSLIDQQENPPPKSDQNQDKNQDKKPNDPKDKKSDMMPMSGMNDMQPMQKGTPPGGMDQQPMGNNDDQPKGRRPRQQNGEQPKESQPMDPGGKQPMGGMASKDPKNPGGARPDPQGDPKNMSKPTLPFEDEVVKDVWGHLPDKLRQQATQYYQQEFMPRYAELLKLYYSSLSEKGAKKP